MSHDDLKSSVYWFSKAFLNDAQLSLNMLGDFNFCDVLFRKENKAENKNISFNKTNACKREKAQNLYEQRNWLLIGSSQLFIKYFLI